MVLLRAGGADGGRSVRVEVMQCEMMGVDSYL